MKTNKIGKILNVVILCIISIFMIFPLIWLVRSAFMTQRELMSMPIRWLPSRFNLDNFARALKAAPFGIYFRNSFLLVVVNVTGCILSGSSIAFGFARLKFKGRDIWFALLLSTMMLPYTVLMIPQFIGWKAVGAYNTFFPLMLPSFFGHAFNVFLIRQFYMAIPKDYDEAALVDGANYLVIYARILVPMAKPALCSVGVFTFMSTWNDFMGPLLYLDKQSIRTVALGLQVFIGQYTSQMNLMMSAAALAVLPMIAIFFVAQRYFIEGITFSGLKG